MEITKNMKIMEFSASEIVNYKNKNNGIKCIGNTEITEMTLNLFKKIYDWISSFIPLVS